MTLTKENIAIFAFIDKYRRAVEARVQETIGEAIPRRLEEEEAALEELKTAIMDSQDTAFMHGYNP